jgi:hypothetical protein
MPMMRVTDIQRGQKIFALFIAVDEWFETVCFSPVGHEVHDKFPIMRFNFVICKDERLL